MVGGALLRLRRSVQNYQACGVPLFAIWCTMLSPGAITMSAAAIFLFCIGRSSEWVTKPEKLRAECSGLTAIKHFEVTGIAWPQTA